MVVETNCVFCARLCFSQRRWCWLWCHANRCEVDVFKKFVAVRAGRRAPVMASGVRQLPCPYCPMRFKRRWNLNMHVHTHTGERPYQCCYCFRAFADRSNMRKHILIHTCKQPMA
ncbi:uncharacterized protein LOC142558621 isoform X1 [Dermacentor variabilis]|uniref:uncharacterized protein LOC142558621 isoform X1 n=1 Tax=Dermacentor variabilis TaxID=34621 RepID=UPI003F5C5552